MAMSATLKAGQCHSPQYTSRKSVTARHLTLSMRLPRSAAENAPQPEEQRAAVGGRARNMHDDDRHEQRRSQKEPELPARFLAVQKAEGRAAVEHVDDVEASVNDGKTLSHGKACRYAALVSWSSTSQTSATEKTTIWRFTAPFTLWLRLLWPQVPS